MHENDGCQAIARLNAEPGQRAMIVFGEVRHGRGESNRSPARTRLALAGTAGELSLTVDDVAKKLPCSATKISRIEAGSRRASLRDVRDLCQVYGIGEEDTADLMDLARQAREPGWWTQYDDLKLSPLIGLEQEAVAITSLRCTSCLR